MACCELFLKNVQKCSERSCRNKYKEDQQAQPCPFQNTSFSQHTCGHVIAWKADGSVTSSCSTKPGHFDSQDHETEAAKWSLAIIDFITFITLLPGLLTDSSFGRYMETTLNSLSTFMFPSPPFLSRLNNLNNHLLDFLEIWIQFFSTLLTLVVYCQIIKLWSWGCFNIVFLLWSFGRFVGWKSESFLNPLLHLSHAEFLLVAMVTRWTKEGKVEKVEPSQTETWLIFVW